MSSSHCGHLFIFHDDDEPRPVTLQADEVVVAGNPGDENRVPYRKQYSPSASETESIRSQSAYLDGFIRRNPTLSTHLWPSQLRGISQSSLYHVIRSLTGSTGAPPPQGLNQLQDLSSICQVIWILQCKWEPFQRAASIILRSYDGKEVNEAEARCLTMITFVLRRDDELKTHLQNLLWLSDATLDLPIEYLRDWVNDRRKENLEIVYDFFHEKICRLHGKYKNSEAMSKIYSDLTENADRSGIRVDFGAAWSTHRNSRRILLDMSPDKLAGDVLSIIVREVGKPGGDLNGVTEDASDIEARSSGQRGGRGGDIWEFVISMLPRIGRRRIEQGAIPAIYDVVKTGTERRTEWRELIDPKGQKFGQLLSWRNAEQDRWFVVPANANGHPVQHSNSP